MQKINFMPRFILINSIPRFILTCCFESLWTRLTTPTWNDSINLLLLLIPYQMRKTNFITQLILDIKVTHYLSSLWACLDMPDYIYLKQPTNVCCFYGTLVTSKNSSSYLNLFVWYCTPYNSAFLLSLRFLDHNSRTRFFPNIFLLQGIKRPLVISYWSKKVYLNG